jgi:hypothetical protein
MNLIGWITLGLFAACWVVGVASWFYGHFVLAWVRWRTPNSRRHHIGKSFRAGAVFFGIWVVGSSIGLIGDSFGDWATLSP